MADSSGEEVVFTIDSRLLEELGENLVTRNHVAVGELIKNSYDADASEVIIEFKDAKADDTSDSEIAIIDDGTGMTLEEVRDDFMRIATTSKRRNPISEKYGRKKAGDKGIGRFACRRLANILEITTTAKIDDGVYQRTSLEINWRDYEEDQEIEEVSFPVTVEEVTEDDESDISTGTELRLKDLQESWNERDFDTLRRNVTDLAVVQAQDRPEGEEPDPGFEIRFHAPEFDKGEGTLSEQVHDAGWGCLEGKISDDGTVELELEAKLIGKQSYSFTYETEGLAGTTFKISYIPLGKKENFRDPQTLSLSQAREISKEQSGVRVYKGGFRVFSYGGPNDDWLGINQERATHGNRSPDERFEGMKRDLDLHQEFDKVLLSGPNNRNLVGRVMISSDADLEMAANREEFQENELVDDLRKVVRLSLQWMTLQWSHYKSQKSKKELEEKKEKFLEETEGQGSSESDDEDSNKIAASVSESDTEDNDAVDSALNLLEGAANTATESVSEDEQQISDEAVDTATKVIKNTIDQKEEEIDFFRSAFSVNQVIFSFSHELRSMVNDLGSSASRIEGVIEDLPEEHQPRFEEVIANLRKMEERFESQMELFGIFMETGDQKNAEEQQISEVVNDVFEATEYIADYYNVEFSTEIRDLLYTPPMYKSELYSIVINLVTNSIKAVGTSTEEENRIHIGADKSSDEIKIRVCDNGVGIPEEDREDAFQPLVSDPADNIYDNLSKQMPEQLSEQLGRGTGLGLSIVRNIAEKYGGGAQFVDDDDWTTCVEVTLSE